MPSYAPPPTMSMAPQSFGQTVKDGMALGIGSSVGQRMTSWFLGPPKVEMVGGAAAAPAAVGPKPPCADWKDIKQQLDTCLNNSYTTAACSKEFDALKVCFDGSTSK